MSVFFSSVSPTADPRLADLWFLLENELFEDALHFAKAACTESHAPVEFFCGLSFAYGELGLYEDAESVARTVIGLDETHWRARHALAVALLHQGRFLGALDTLGFHRSPPELYVTRTQIEHIGEYKDSLRVTLDDAFQQAVPPAARLYLAYLCGSEIPERRDVALAEIRRLSDHLGVWERDTQRHTGTAYGNYLGQHITTIRRLLTGPI